MDLSIIIVNYNTRELLKNCLRSVVNNTNGIDCEIIVVDNASSDDSRKMLETEFPDIRVINNNANLGYAKANNQGIMIAKGNNILLLNSDTLILNGALSKTFEFVNSKKDAGVVGCKVLNPDCTLQYTCYREPGFISEIIFFTKTIIKNFWDPISYHKYMRYWNHERTREVDCVAGCFMWIKRELIEQIGLLDEQFFMYYEDTEFCRRARAKSKYKVYYYPMAQIIHLKGGSSHTSNIFIMQQCYQSAKYYLIKYYGWYWTQIFVFWCKSLWFIEMNILRLFGFNKKILEKMSLISALYHL